MNKSRHIRLPLVSLMVIVFLLVTTIAVNATPAEQEGTCFPAKSITWRPWEHGSYLRANVGNCTAYSQFRSGNFITDWGFRYQHLDSPRLRKPQH